MPNLKTPCPLCKSKGRHRKMADGTPCPNKRASSPRKKEAPEDRLARLREEVAGMPDGDFAAHLRHVLIEEKLRERKIRDEAAGRLRALKDAREAAEDAADAVADEPTIVERATTQAANVARSMSSVRAEAPSAEPYDGPPGVCGAMYPDNILIKCKQQTRGGKHPGMHYNREHKKSWQQDVPKAASGGK